MPSVETAVPSPAAMPSVEAAVPSAEAAVPSVGPFSHLPSIDQGRPREIGPVVEQTAAAQRDFLPRRKTMIRRYKIFERRLFALHYYFSKQLSISSPRRKGPGNVRFLGSEIEVPTRRR
jgi:hypothetical protein